MSDADDFRRELKQVIERHTDLGPSRLAMHLVAFANSYAMEKNAPPTVICWDEGGDRIEDEAGIVRFGGEHEAYLGIEDEELAEIHRDKTRDRAGLYDTVGGLDA